MALHRKPTQRSRRRNPKRSAANLPVDPRAGCPRPDKRHWRTAHAAKSAIADGPDAVVLSTYRCPCGRWCLTSKGGRR